MINTLFCFEVKEIDIANPVLLLNPSTMHSGPMFGIQCCILYQ